jgi:hypothetical protein
MTITYSELKWIDAGQNTVRAVRSDGGLAILDAGRGDLWDDVLAGLHGEILDYIPPDPVPTYASEELARAAMARWCGAFVAPLVQDAPSVEQLAWPVKEAAAVAYLADAASVDQVALITDEADLTGEDPDALAQKILDKAATFRAVVAKISGLRRKISDQLAAAADPFAFDAILDAGKVEALALADDLGLSAVLVSVP